MKFSTTWKPRPASAPYTMPSSGESSWSRAISTSTTTPNTLSVSSMGGEANAGPHRAARSGLPSLAIRPNRASLPGRDREVATTAPQENAAATTVAGSRSKRSSRYTKTKKGMAYSVSRASASSDPTG